LFPAEVEQLFARGVDTVARGDGDFFNILDMYTDVDSTRVFPRGFPYSRRGEYDAWKIEKAPSQRPIFNLGLWSGILDVNAIDKLWLSTWEVENATLRSPNTVIPSGALSCLCSMNMHFLRSVIPAVYQFPMHVEVIPNWVIDRYGDIWGGFVLQTLAARRGDVVSVGGPTIRHCKQGDFKRNMWQEHTAHLVNDEFISVIQAAGRKIQPASYLDMMRQLSEIIVEETERRSPVLRVYFRHLAVSLAAWAEALS